jgi:hypothetical protein
MRIETDNHQITMLNVLKDKLLLSSLGQIFVIKDFTIENFIEDRLFGRKKTVKYITDFKIEIYNDYAKFLGLLSGNSCESVLHRYDLYMMRQQWINFMEQLKAFGFQIVPVNDMTLLEKAFEAGREYQEYKGIANLEEKSWNFTFAKWCEKNNIK